MIVLLVIAAILLLLFLLTLIPVRVAVRFQESFFLEVKYLFLTFPVLPGKEKEEPSKEEKPKKEGEGMGKKLKGIVQRQGVSGFLKALFDFVKLLTSASKRLLSHLRLKRFDLYLCIGGGENAADAAIKYGQMSGGVYSACGILFGLLPCRKKGVSVDMDYGEKEDRVLFSGEFALRPLFVIKEGLAVLFGGLPFFRLFSAKSDSRHPQAEKGAST